MLNASANSAFNRIKELLIDSTYVAAEGSLVQIAFDTPQEAEEFYELMGEIPSREDADV